MLNLTITFRCRRYDPVPWVQATDNAAFEWPPSPWRILRALLYAAETTEDGAQVWPWLKELRTPPHFLIPRVSLGFAPNDVSSRPRGFVIIDPAHPTVSVLWPDLELKKAQLNRLARLCASIQFLGTSSSRTEWSASQDAPIAGDRLLSSPQPAHHPSEKVKLLCPGPSTDAAALHARRPSEGPPLTALLVTYQLPKDAIVGWADSSRGGVSSQIACYEVDGRPPLVLANALAEQARRAAMACYGRLNGGAASALLSGKDLISGRPLEGHRHAYFLPTDDDGDGGVDHLTVLSEPGLGPAEMASLRALELIRPSRFLPSPVRLRWAVPPSASLFLGPSRSWRSHTPFVPFRHTKPDGRDTVGAQIRLELGRRGLPEPDMLRVVPVWRDRDFVLVRPSRVAHPTLAWFEIRFPKDVTGPIAIGAACHFGMGLALPEGERRQAGGPRPSRIPS